MDIVIGVIIIVGGLLMFLMGVASYKDSLISHSWPTTFGKVNSAKVIHKVVDQVNHYTATVEYDYTVNNENYIGNKISIGPVGSLPWIEEEKIRKYPEGSRVQVYYNPQDHSEAILEPGVKSGTVWWLVVTIILVVAGIVQLFFPFMHIDL